MRLSSNLEDVVRRRFESDGVSAEILVRQPGAYDPNQGKSIGLETAYQCKVILLDYPVLNSGSSGNVIQKNDKQILVDATNFNFTPQASVSKIIVNGDKWDIVSLKEYNPTGSRRLVFDIQARK